MGDTRVVAVLREHLRRPCRAFGNGPQLVRGALTGELGVEDIGNRGCVICRR